MTPDPAEFKRAKHCICPYDLEAIGESEAAFLKVVSRDANRCNLFYFFDILQNIQQKLDAERHQRCCRERYNYERMLANERRCQEAEDHFSPSIEAIVTLAAAALRASVAYLRKSALRRCREWIEELIK